MTTAPEALRLTRTKPQRPRQLAHLQHGLGRRLTLVSAQPGAGESAHVCRWLEGFACLNAWLSVDRGDNDLTVFLTYRIAAVRTAFPDACGKTLSLLETLSPAQVEALATFWINELDGVLIQPQDNAIKVFR